MINSEYEFVALHRDVGETELKQGREIHTGGNLVYVDSAAVRAVKHGRVLILEGVEKAERGIMPVCPFFGAFWNEGRRLLVRFSTTS